MDVIEDAINVVIEDAIDVVIEDVTAVEVTVILVLVTGDVLILILTILKHLKTVVDAVTGKDVTAREKQS